MSYKKVVVENGRKNDSTLDARAKIAMTAAWNRWRKRGHDRTNEEYKGAKNESV